MFLPVLLLQAAAPPAVWAANLDVEVRRGPDASGKVQEWFSSLDETLEGFDRASRLLAEEAGRPTVGTARRALALAQGMAQAYRKMARDGSAAAALDKLGGELGAMTRGLHEEEALPAEAFRAVYSLDKGGLYRWIHLLRQGAMEAAGPRGLIQVNALITLRSGERAFEISALELSGKPLAGEGRVLSPALRALGLAASPPAADFGPVVLSGRRLWLRYQGMDAFADLAAPQAGGMIRLRYRERGQGLEEQARFYFLSKALYEAGFSVRVEGGSLEAMAERGRSGLDAGGMEELFSLALKAQSAAQALPPGLKSYLADSPSSRENEARLDYLARVFTAEGELPFLAAPPEALRAAVEEYRTQEPEREARRVQMSKALAASGLDPFPAEIGVGRRSTRLRYERALEAAAARGKGYEPLFRLAAAKPPAAETAAWFMRLAPPLRAIGMVGSRLAQGAQWRLGAGDWLNFYALRGPEGARPAALIAERWTAGTRKSLAAGEALSLLAELGLAPAGPAPAPALPAALPAFSARVTYDRVKASLGDVIYVTPYAAPDDRRALKRCRALVTTEGGALAAVLAAEAGIPALELGAARWTQASGLEIEVPAFSAPRPAPSGVPVRAAAKARWATLREGDVVRLDPAGGRVEFLDPDRQAVLLRLEEALKAYERGADIGALSLWTVSQLRSLELTPAQKRLLAAELSAELEKRRKAGAATAAHLDRIRAVLKENL